MKLNLKLQLGFAVLIASFLFSLCAKAATLELSLDKEIVSSKDDVSVLVTVNSEGQDINTAQATISFPVSLLEVIEVDRTDSIFSFWLEGPIYDNNKGTIRFAGGATSGFTGASLRVFRVAFRVKGSGTGRLGISDGAITASDGTGSNVYTTAKGLDINIPSTAEFQSVKLERVRQEATIAKALPAQLGLDIPFYPNQLDWNNRSASFQAKWNISPDTINGAVSIDKNPNSIPTASVETLTGSKIFPALTDGVWYLHLRLENNIGWSSTLHYRLAIDTTPPAPFKIISNVGFQTANPRPTIKFNSSDLTSGINSYSIRLDDVLATTTKLSSYQFSPLLPGVHQLVVVSTDKAGNSTSETETLEILPIEAPEITYLTRQAIVNVDSISAGGISLSGDNVVIQIQNNKKQIEFEQVVPVDRNGNWSTTINKAFNLGKYYLIVTAKDMNMSSSFPVISESINVKSKPVLTLGNLEVTLTGFFIGLVLILLIGFASGWLAYHNWREQLGRRVTVAQRDVISVIDHLDEDIIKLSKVYNKISLSKTDLTEISYILESMEDNLKKSRHYVIDNIREINK